MPDQGEVEREWAWLGLPYSARTRWSSGSDLWDGTVEVQPRGLPVAYGSRPGAAGTLAMPERVDLTFTGDDPAPRVEITVEVRLSVPVATSVRVTSSDSAGVRSADLRGISVDTLVQRVAEETSIEVSKYSEGAWEATAADPADAHLAAERPRSPRPRRRRSEVEAAAAIFLESIPTGAPVAAVAERMHLSKRTAHRYVAEARAAGLLPARGADDNGERRS